MTAPRPLRPGEELAPGYAVLEHLHRGKALDAYAVWSAERECQCVAKVVRPDRLAETRTRRRLFREGRLLAALTHPNIVRAYETLSRPQPTLILETLTGATVAYLIEVEHERRGLPVADVAELGLQLCSAVGYLHGRRLLHLDLKPSNVVAELGLAKLIDLSIARSPGRAGRGVGTKQYMAPEQARGGAIGPAADVWGVGALLYEAATGRRPFERRPGVKYPQLDERARPVGQLRRLPRGLAAAIDACLEPESRRRPSVPELAVALRPSA
jgi:serine/threonine protein kinase